MSMKKLFTRLAAGLAVCLLPLGASAQSVTVHSDGVSGDFQYLVDAIAHVQDDPSGPDIITLIDVGPHITTGSLILGGDDSAGGDAAVPSPMTLQGDDSLGERPTILLSSGGADGSAGLFVNTPGTSTLRNLTLMLRVGSSRGGSLVRYNAGASRLNPLDITIDNVLISSNNGSDEPYTQDGFTLDTPIPTDLATMQGPIARGIWLSASNADVVHNVSITNTVVSAIPGYTGIRVDMNGASGSDIHIGEGFIASYMQGINVTAGGLDLRGHQRDGILRVQGTDTNPIRVFNNPGANVAGIKVWPSATPEFATKTFEHVILANNGQAGIWVRRLGAANNNDNLVINNATIANNGGPALHILDNAGDDGWTSGTITANNVIFAGNGTSDANNVFSMVIGTTPGTDPGQAIFNDSAIVLSGDYALTGDGFAPASPANVTLNNVINDDPGFLDTYPGDNFYRAGAAAYSNATPPVTGAWDSNVATVREWMMLD